MAYRKKPEETSSRWMVEEDRDRCVGVLISRQDHIYPRIVVVTEATVADAGAEGSRIPVNPPAASAASVGALPDIGLSVEMRR